ncbi:TPR domain protein [Luminiphilus syltensis NOR5-1B]|uniref:Lipopolysaccharide assembly protein B n=1 Tax=Luminiphilus syltensis NOR5-1B TaxID=565045 RepID=B8KX34_9GAMM|nr:lipopolysaccharide assembly protein LapB [Luminiphilus syltensis]EED34629.1 TPR domain protein [Luminiphilus syltensis NOR5-1B]
MSDPALLGLFFVAVGLGWLLGRGGIPGVAPRSLWRASLPSQYYRGLNFLLDGSQDNAIDAFTRALEVNSETFDTHIALGNVLRRRGEVERAIRIHQNLLARPSLPAAQLHLAHLELARDYISAGLFDRAERLLLDLVSESGNHRRVAQRHLIEIYEAQSDWDSAREVAEALLPKKTLLTQPAVEADEVGQPVNLILAHFCCEQAESPQEMGDLSAARKLLDQALKYDGDCVRASMMLADIEFRTSNFSRSLKLLKSVQDQDADFVPETVPALRACYSAIDKRPQFRNYLESCFRARPSTMLVLAIAQELSDTESPESAKQFLRESLREKPTLRGLAMLMSLHDADEAGTDEALEVDIIQRLVSARSLYRCQHCGFKAQQLHWYCPGCKHWGTIKEQGALGEFVHA